MKTILVATMGTTPSVLASTVWELAVHPQEFLGEEKSIVPDKVIVFGTARSKAELSKALFRRETGRKPTGWERLRSALEKYGVTVDGKLKFSEGNIFTFRNDAGEEIDDIRNAKDCYCVANLIVKELRDLSATDDCRILASISGGRKPESAILLSCMNLLGRERDAVIHIIPAEWPSPTDGCKPPFLFPGQGSTHEKKDPEKGRIREFKSEDIQFNLINIPFIRVRDCLPELEGNRLLPSFGELVARSQHMLDQSIQSDLPDVRFNFDAKTITLSNNGKTPETIEISAAVGFFVLACDLLVEKPASDEVFLKVRRSARHSDEHPLVGEVRQSRFWKKGDRATLEGDFFKLRRRTNMTLMEKSQNYAFAAQRLAGKGYVRSDSYPRDKISDNDKRIFLGILKNAGIL